MGDADALAAKLLWGRARGLCRSGRRLAADQVRAPATAWLGCQGLGDPAQVEAAAFAVDGFEDHAIGLPGPGAHQQAETEMGPAAEQDAADKGPFVQHAGPVGPPDTAFEQKPVLTLANFDDSVLVQGWPGFLRRTLTTRCTANRSMANTAVCARGITPNRRAAVP